MGQNFVLLYYNAIPIFVFGESSDFSAIGIYCTESDYGLLR